MIVGICIVPLLEGLETKQNVGDGVGGLALDEPACKTARGLEIAGSKVELKLNVKTAHRTTHGLGRQLLIARRCDLQRYCTGQMPAGTEMASKRICVQIDGGRVRLRKVTRKQKGKGQSKKQRRRYQTDWRDVKLLIIYEIDEKGEKVRTRCPWIDGTFGGPDEAMELLAMHLHRLGAVGAEVVVFLADELISGPSGGFPSGVAKESFGNGDLVFTGQPPAGAPAGLVTWPDGSTMKVPVLSATQAFAELTSSKECPGCATTPLEVTAIKPATLAIATSRGRATVPAWAFTLKGVSTPVFVAALPARDLAAAPASVRAWLPALPAR